MSASNKSVVLCFWALVLTLVLVATRPGLIHAQEPPDTLVQDTLVLDSLQVSEVADSVAADSVPPPPVLPTLPAPLSGVSAPGVWEWNAEELTGRRGHSVWELLTEIPGVLAIRTGDFGAPMTAFPTGYAGGGLKVYFDGIEHLPVEGSLPDLSRVGISGLERIRVVRRGTGIEIHLDRYVHRDSRAFSTIEAGTGDLGTNIFRGTFSLPSAVRGKASVGLERIDTRGRGGNTPGAITGGSFRYSVHRGDQAGLRFELRNVTTNRTDSLLTPTSVRRTDWSVQGNWALTSAVHASGWATQSQVVAGDSLETLPFNDESRGQYGARLSAGQGALRTYATARLNQGVGLAEREFSGEVSWTTPQGHGISTMLWNEGWGDRSGSGFDARAWMSPVKGVMFFAELGSGDRAVPFLPTLPSGTVLDSLLMNLNTTDPDPRFTHRESIRLGAQLEWGGFFARGAAVEVEADSVWPTGLPFDLGGPVLPQLSRRGWEVEGRIPLWPNGLSLKGGVQVWESTDSTVAQYFPDHWYHGSLSFHNQYLPTGNFELWVDVGAQGRPEMTVPVAFNAVANPMGTAVTELVPFYQNWFFRLQARVVSVNIFATIENLSLRPFNQDVPGRLLPRTRSLYGIRWNLWN